MNSSPVPLPDWLLADYPFTPRSFLTAAGARMSYLDEAPTPELSSADSAVLLVHGNPTWSYFYRHVIKAMLADGRRCVAPDHIGMGLSEKPQNYRYTLSQRIVDLEGLVLSLGLKQIDLVVHDWGGAIGFGFAARHPEKIRRIVILNSAAYPSTRIPNRIALCKTTFPGTLLVRGLNAFAWSATYMAMHRRKLSASEKRAYLYPYDTWANRVAVDAFIKDIPLDGGHPSFKALERAADGIDQFRRKPVMIVWGATDFCFDASFYEEWRRRLPEAEAHLLADVGHYVADDGRDQVPGLIAKHFRG